MDDLQQRILLGNKISSVRKEKGLTIRQLAKELDVTPSLLSQIERGLANPSLNTLRMLAIKLDISLFSLFYEENKMDKLITRRDQRTKFILPQTNFEYDLLSPDMHGAIEMVIMNIPPQEESSTELLNHIGEEIAYVLNGEVQIFLENNMEILQAGDSIKIPSNVYHKWRNTSDKVVSVLFAMTPPSF